MRDSSCIARTRTPHSSLMGSFPGVTPRMAAPARCRKLKEENVRLCVAFAASRSDVTLTPLYGNKRSMSANVASWSSDHDILSLLRSSHRSSFWSRYRPTRGPVRAGSAAMTGWIDVNTLACQSRWADEFACRRFDTLVQLAGSFSFTTFCHMTYFRSIAVVIFSAVKLCFASVASIPLLYSIATSVPFYEARRQKASSPLGKRRSMYTSPLPDGRYARPMRVLLERTPRNANASRASSFVRNSRSAQNIPIPALSKRYDVSNAEIVRHPTATAAAVA